MLDNEKPHLSRDGTKWTVLVEPHVYRTQTFAQACEVARRIVGPDRHMPAFLWLRTRPDAR